MHPLHRLWRHFPPEQRRAVFAASTAALAPRPDRAPPTIRWGIAVGGEIGRASGLGEGARLMTAALRDAGIPSLAFPAGVTLPGEARPAVPALPEGAALVLHVNADLLPASLLRLGRRVVRGRRIIGYWAWELPVVPATWRGGSRFVHEVWVPSRFTAAAVETLLPGRVRVVPHPVAISPPRPSALTRADFALPTDAVVTLVNFNLASSFERKNPLGAIAAFRAAFGERVDRLLVLKVGHPEHAPADMQRLHDAVAGAGNIRIETRILPQADLHALTRACDVVLSLHRSEGFGLVPAEALLLGRAVVATDWSGTTDFLDATNAWPIPARLIEARDPRGVFATAGSVWADPDLGAAAKALATLADDPQRRAALGAAAASSARARLGAGKLMEAVRALGPIHDA